MNRSALLAVARSSAVVGLLGCMAFTRLDQIAGPIIPEEGVQQAVGKLFYEEAGLQRDCTSFLLDDRHVVTAQHCVDGGPGERPVVRVLLGYDNATLRLVVEPTEIDRPLTGRDIAHLCLPRPATTEHLKAAARVAMPGERVAVVHYAAPNLHRQQKRECKVVTYLRNNEFVIDCGFDTGASGAPVIGALPNHPPEVLGVVIKSGKEFAVAVPLVQTDLAMCGGLAEGIASDMASATR